MSDETPGAVVEEQSAEVNAETQAAEHSATEGGESRQATEKEASEESKGQDSDGKGGPQKLASDYKKLQGEYTRTTQELADLRRQSASWEAEKAKVAEVARKADALEKLAANPKFKAWAEQELLSQQYGTDNWEDLNPQQQLQYLQTMTERKAEEIADRKLAALRQEYEPARQKAAEADAQAAVQRVAEKYGDLWTDNLEAFKQLIVQYDQAAATNPEIKRALNNPTEEMIETIFLRAIGPRIKDIGKKAYLAELDKKRKAQVADGKSGSTIASEGPAKTIEEAFAAAKRSHNIQKVTF